MTELSIVLTAHNRADLVEETLASLAEQEWDGEWDVVLVDNDSSDATLEILERWADKMPVPTRVVEARDDHNLCYSRNAGVAASSATNVAFLDDDDVIAPGFVAAMGTALRHADFAGPRHEHALLNPPELARYRGSFQTDALGEIFGVTIVSGGGLACRRRLWDDLDGQRVELGYGAEDADFSLRAVAVGVEPIFVADAVYHVRLRGGLRSSFTQGRRFATARVRLFAEHRTATDERAMSPLRLLKAWAGLLRRLPTIRHEGPRLIWMWQLGRRVGHLEGSLRERTWYP